MENAKENKERIVPWNIKSLNRNHEIKEEFPETKKNGNGKKIYGDYVMLFTLFNRKTRAAERMGIFIQSKYSLHWRMQLPRKNS